MVVADDRVDVGLRRNPRPGCPSRRPLQVAAHDVVARGGVEADPRAAVADQDAPDLEGADDVVDDRDVIGAPPLTRAPGARSPRPCSRRRDPVRPASTVTPLPWLPGPRRLASTPMRLSSIWSPFVPDEAR